MLAVGLTGWAAGNEEKEQAGRKEPDMAINDPGELGLPVQPFIDRDAFSEAADIVDAAAERSHPDQTAARTLIDGLVLSWL